MPADSSFSPSLISFVVISCMLIWDWKCVNLFVVDRGLFKKILFSREESPLTSCRYRFKNVQFQIFSKFKIQSRKC